MKTVLQTMMTLAITAVIATSITSTLTISSSAHAQNMGLVDCPPGFV